MPSRTAQPHSRPQRRISERGKARLRIAAALLRLQGLGDADDLGFGAILQAIDRLGDARRAQLRSLVDWVEAYEMQEHVHAGVERVRTSPAERPRRS